MMDEIIFENLKGIGDLRLEHTFYEYEEPILFACVDAKKERYICSCCRLSEQWIVAHVSPDMLIEMMEKKRSLDTMFVDTPFMLTWDGKELEKIDGTIPQDLLPRAGAYLRLSHEKICEYLAAMEQFASKELRAEPTSPTKENELALLAQPFSTDIHSFVALNAFSEHASAFTKCDSIYNICIQTIQESASMRNLVCHYLSNVSIPEDLSEYSHTIYFQKSSLETEQRHISTHHDMNQTEKDLDYQFDMTVDSKGETSFYSTTSLAYAM